MPSRCHCHLLVPMDLVVLRPSSKSCKTQEGAQAETRGDPPVPHALHGRSPDASSRAPARGSACLETHACLYLLKLPQNRLVPTQGGSILPPEGKQGLAPHCRQPPRANAPAWQPSSVGPWPHCHPTALGFAGSRESPRESPPAQAPLGAGQRRHRPPTRATQFATRMVMPAPGQPRGGAVPLPRQVRDISPQQGGDQRVPSSPGDAGDAGSGLGSCRHGLEGRGEGGGERGGCRGQRAGQGSARPRRSVTLGGSTRVQSPGTYQTGAV